MSDEVWVEMSMSRESAQRILDALRSHARAALVRGLYDEKEATEELRRELADVFGMAQELLIKDVWDDLLASPSKYRVKDFVLSAATYEITDVARSVAEVNRCIITYRAEGELRQTIKHIMYDHVYLEDSDG